MLLGRSPLRISFAGGGTDLEEYYNKYDGFTVSFTISKFTYVIAKLRQDKKFQGFSPDFASHHPPKMYKKIQPIQGHEIILATVKQMNFRKGIDVFFCSDVTSGSGLGASSSLTSNLVNVISKIKNENLGKKMIAEKAYHIGHNILKWNIGKQDEYSSVFGGLNLLKFTKNNVCVEKINLSKSGLKELQTNSMLFYMKKRRFSSDVILHAQADKTIKENPKTIQALHNAKELALELRDALRKNDLSKFGEIIKKGWNEKKKYTNQVSDKNIDSVVQAALNSGAEGIKIPGAGGGGHLYIYAPKSKHQRIEQNLKKYSVKRIDFKFEHNGVKVMETGLL